MYSLSRLQLFRQSCVRLSSEVLSACDTSGKVFNFSQNLNFCTRVSSEPKNTWEEREKSYTKGGFRAHNNKPFYKPTVYYSDRFHKLVSLITESEEKVSDFSVYIINKLYTISQRENKGTTVYSDFQKFLNSDKFEKFCENLHDKLPKLKPGALLTALKLEYFGIPVESKLMRKVLTLILDNINFYNAFEKIVIFLRISRPYFDGSIERENLRKTLDVYFDSVFEKEVYFCQDYYLMKIFMEDPKVPLKVKQIMGRKLLDDFNAGKIYKGHLNIILKSILTQPVPLFSHSERVEFLKNTFSFCAGTMLSKYMRNYRKIVELDDSLFVEEICKEAAAECANLLFFDKKIFVMQAFCLMGYLNDEVLKKIADDAVTVNFKGSKFQTILTLAYIFVQTRIHERNVVTPEDWRALKEVLEAYESERLPINPTICKWCQYLTFLGCDTRDALSAVFLDFEEITVPSEVYMEGDAQSYVGYVSELLLQLHHLGKAYFPNGFTPLPSDKLKKLLKNSAVVNDSIPAGLIQVLGGEDYLLKNCTTSDNHFLHYVAVLGPDNKPVNLSRLKRKAGLCNVEGIQRPPGSRLVTFQNFSERHLKYRNAPVVPGMVDIFLKSLQSLNSDIILLPFAFEMLPTEKQTEYLTSRLNEITEKR